MGNPLNELTIRHFQSGFRSFQLAGENTMQGLKHSLICFNG
jgi:hypothetical protein